MLEVGNGMTLNEDRTHFSLWCMMAAPLMAGNDLRKMTGRTGEILTNRDMIAIDQDALGIQGFKYADKDGLQVWFKPLKNGDWAACFINRSGETRQIAFDWKKEKVTDALNRLALDGNTAYTIYDIWKSRNAGTTTTVLNISLASHDAAVFRLKK
jgi:alpha-galactosidase